MGLHIGTDALGMLFQYYAELERWNRKVNLVSRKQPDWVRVHFLDSLAAAGLSLLTGTERIVDLGAGAGFPGLPLKIIQPGTFLGMAEASSKKCAFLKHVVRKLDISNTAVLEGRFEDSLGSGWKSDFHVAVSRAAAKPSLILERAKPFLKEDGRVLVYTTLALTQPGLGKVHPYNTPGSRVPSVIWEVSVSELP